MADRVDGSQLPHAGRLPGGPRRRVGRTVHTGDRGVGGQEAGEKLKSASGWLGLDRETNKPGNGTNATGFNGEPFGFISYKAGFFGLGYSSNWWISSGDSFMASFISKELIHNGFETQAGYYIRCIKDK